MSIAFTNKGYELMLDSFGKTLVHTPVTKTLNPMTGEEILTDGTTASITGALFRKIDDYAQKNPGLFTNADAVLMVKDDVSLSKNDKIDYDGDTFRIHEVTLRRLGTTGFYYRARCFLI